MQLLQRFTILDAQDFNAAAGPAVVTSAFSSQNNSVSSLSPCAASLFLKQNQRIYFLGGGYQFWSQESAGALTLLNASLVFQIDTSNPQKVRIYNAFGLPAQAPGPPTGTWTTGLGFGFAPDPNPIDGLQDFRTGQAGFNAGTLGGTGLRIFLAVSVLNSSGVAINTVGFRGSFTFELWDQSTEISGVTGKRLLDRPSMPGVAAGQSSAAPTPGQFWHKIGDFESGGDRGESG